MENNRKTINEEEITLNDPKRVNANKWGHPRFVVHFTSFLRSNEYRFLGHEQAYATALKRARPLGYKVYKGRDYGGGFVITSFLDINQLEGKVEEASVNW